jgi:hypothetical protein
MQSIPIFATVEGLTIFRDDVDLTNFYYLPRTLRIKKDAVGKPMFTFLKYTLPVERQTTEELGGGYLVFTTELTEDGKFLTDSVLPVLASRLAAENPNVPNLPPPKLSAMDFLSGEVRLLMMRDGKVVSEIQAGKPSLFGDNTASFAVELKTMGADLLYRALMKGAGVAVIEYDLMFDVRLPAVHVHAHADSKEIHEATIGYSVEHVTDQSTWGDVENDVRHHSSLSESMESMGLIELTVDVGTTGVQGDDLEALRTLAFSKLDDWVKEHFLKGGSMVREDNRKSAWMTYIHEDIHQSFNLDLVQRSVIQRAYSPSAQMTQGFLGGEVDALVMDIDLGTAAWYFNNLDVKVDTNLDFTKYGDIVHSVVGRFSYLGTTEDGEKVEKRESLIFTADDTVPKNFRTRLAAVGADTWHVDVEVHYKSGPVASAVLVSEDKIGVRDYTLSVPNPGVMEMTVFAQDPQAFDSVKLSSIEVEIGYDDASRNVPDLVDTVVLTKAKDSVDYRRVIYAPWDKPFKCRRTYVLTDGGATQRITTPWETIQHEAQQKHQLPVGTLFDRLFNLTVMPSVDWTDVAAVLVDLEYADDEHDYRQKTTLSFSKTAVEPIKWSFPLRDPDKRGYRMSEKLLMVNSAAQAGPWKDIPSDADTLLVGNAKGGVITVNVDPSDTGVGTTVRRMVIKLRCDDEVGKVHDAATLVFKDPTPRIWSVALADATVTDYSYDVEYLLPDGTVQTLAGKGVFSGINTFLFIPAPTLPSPVPVVPVRVAPVHVAPVRVRPAPPAPALPG